MKLVVLGNESLDALQAMVLSSFADVSQGSRPDTDLQVPMCTGNNHITSLFLCAVTFSKFLLNSCVNPSLNPCCSLSMPGAWCAV
jgi:hypothetical protein